MKVTVQEVIQALYASGEQSSYGIRYDLASRIESHGIATPDGYAIVPIEKQYLKRQPCGCVLCTCEDEIQCQGCGAKYCADHNSKNLPVLTAAPKGELE